MHHNHLNQPIGNPLPNFTAGEYPNVTLLQGRFCRLEKLSPAHAEDLFAVYSSDERYWTYLPLDPFDDKKQFSEFLQQISASTDPYYFAIIDEKTGQAVGIFALMRIDPNNRVIEVGWVIYSPKLQRTKIATEAQFLLAQYVFESLQYRRYEWKCDSLNEPSRKAALRLGFTYEGTFRQAQVYNGRTRDTAWFSMLDIEWQNRKSRFQKWLSDENFDEHGRQKKSLAEC
ncbi:N-acetyltransferase [Actinobacillus succinogenes]|uniref:GCN5-related N-acetyltransferase n=1 Tax=Actinobacillus succinogenes (strain ATCC 55618 / DSM 22257 / CCUG 43843 / 130Z) TaxID=339671 RepID=A6VM14_ACTSZ|nr:GNAT family protein [Actinobacillus succinogenes]ABR74011.1 GCN5-related N-acetyltransferase [Actinobacillus succinogenes 130Z]PHI39550.1 N-acetyltransferase [Actinobacillus succinogenes]